MITYREYFNRRAEGETVKAIAESIGKSTKALNRALERVGYVSEGTGNNQRWIWKSEGVEPLEQELIFGRVTTQKHDASISKSNNESIVKSEKESKDKSDSDSKNDLDYLLQDKKQNRSQYRGFYLSDESIQVLEKVPSGNKSELVDELIKRFGREKGLL